MRAHTLITYLDLREAHRQNKLSITRRTWQRKKDSDKTDQTMSPDFGDISTIQNTEKEDDFEDGDTD